MSSNFNIWKDIRSACINSTLCTLHHQHN